METLILPERATIQLIDEDNSQVKVPNVLFAITAFARRKSDFHLSPFATSDTGLATITKKELEAEVAANYDYGLMDYADIAECSPSVEIRLLTDEDIARAVEARKNVWTALLDGERDRWSSLEELLSLYGNANNGKLLPRESRPMRVDWRVAGAAYSYEFPVWKLPLDGN